ncbi:MAG TPA: hypothetical protein VEY92_07995, partial [Pseudoxanthomonas sp.]|nr:hypothetical protein [Pseudoxanthomonas sp.]
PGPTVTVRMKEDGCARPSVARRLAPWDVFRRLNRGKRFMSMRFMPMPMPPHPASRLRAAAGAR